jgi:hypothetical protein
MTMTQGNYALRLRSSLKAEAERVAKAEGTTLNQFINVAVAEKLSALRTAEFFRERAARADVKGAITALRGLGWGREAARGGREIEAPLATSTPPADWPNLGAQIARRAYSGPHRVHPHPMAPPLHDQE